MNCPRCGKELKEVCKLTEEQMQDLELAATKETVAMQALSKETMLDLIDEMTDEKLFVYIKANTDVFAEAIFLQNQFMKDLRKVHKISNPEIIDGVVYDHIE